MIVKKRALPSERSAFSPYILIGLTNIQNYLYLMIVYPPNLIFKIMKLSLITSYYKNENYDCNLFTTISSWSLTSCNF